MNIHDVVVWNTEEDREATPGEIKVLLSEELLFIGYRVHGNTGGRVFIDLEYEVDDFTLRHKGGIS